MLYAFSLSPKSFLSLTITLTLLFTPFCVSSVFVCVSICMWCIRFGSKITRTENVEIVSRFVLSFPHESSIPRKKKMKSCTGYST